MTKTMKTSLAVFKHELQLQFVSIGLVLFFFVLSMLMTRFIISSQRGLDQLFFGFYTVAMAFILPWQLNTTGHISPGYCRYHLSLPVATWQLSIIPFLSRLLLILSFILLESLCHYFLFGPKSYYVTASFILHSFQAALMVYLLLQAFAWSKDCIKNLFFWIFIGIGLLFIFKAKEFGRIVDSDNLIIYLLIVATFLTLALVGVRNLRRGIILKLPGWNTFATPIEKLSFKRNKQHKNAGAAHFHQLWKRSWYYMPLITLAIIGAMYVISKPRHPREWLAYECTKAGTAYVAMIIIASIVGIIIINGKAFNSSYTANLPVNTRVISIAKIKCFCLSFAISLGVFLLWIGHMLFIDGRLLKGIEMRSEVLLHSPGVIVWMLTAFIIWSYALAFAVIAGYMKYRIFTLVTTGVMVTLIINAFFVSNSISSIVRLLNLRIPAYVLVLSGINILLFGKLALCCCNAKKWKRYITITAACIGAVILTFLCCKYSILFVIPLAALFAYPIIAMEYDDKQQDHEIIPKPAFPKRLIAGVVIIFLCFSGFTAWLNTIQKTELNSQEKQCKSQDLPFRQSHVPSESYAEYIKINLPYKKELLSKLMTSCNWHISGREAIRPWEVRTFLTNTVTDMLKKHEYRKAFNVLIFTLKMGLTWKNAYPYYPQIKKVLKYYTASPDELNEITSILRKSLKYRLEHDPKDLIKIVTSHSKFTPAFTFMSSQYYFYNSGSKQLKYLYSNQSFELLYFNQCFLSPLCYNERLNHETDVYHTLKAINYVLTGEEKYFTKHRISGMTLFSHGRWTCNSILMAVVDIASIKYQRKYGKKPESIKQLVPEFLYKNEIWLFNTDFYKPVLIPNKL